MRLKAGRQVWRLSLRRTLSKRSLRNGPMKVTIAFMTGSLGWTQTSREDVCQQQDSLLGTTLLPSSPTMVPSDPWEVFTDNGFSMASRGLRLVWNHTAKNLTCSCLGGNKEARGWVICCRWPVTILRSSVSINSCVIFTFDLLWFDHLAKIFAVWVGFQLERRKRGWTTLAVCPHKGRQATP